MRSDICELSSTRNKSQGLLTSAALLVTLPQFPLKVITRDCMSFSLNYYTDTLNYVQEKSTVR